jgi:hypothetical protein
MPKSEDWYKKSNHKEIIIPVYDKTLVEKQIRVRIVKTEADNRGVKKVKRFSVGFEILINGEFQNIIRYCNFHEDDQKGFHLHNPLEIKKIASDKKVKMELKRCKSPANQLTWSLRDIRLNYRKYLRCYNRKYINKLDG